MLEPPPTDTKPSTSCSSGEVGGVLEGVDRRLDPGPVVEHHLDPLGLDQPRDPLGVPERRHARIGDEHRAPHAQALELPAGVGGRPGAELHRRGLHREDRLVLGAILALSSFRTPVGVVPTQHGSRTRPDGGRRHAPRAHRSRSDVRIRARLDRTLPGTRPGSWSAPPTPQEVAGVIEVCAAERVAVVAQGGNTGLVGAQRPPRRRVVMSLLRLSAYRPRRRRRGAGHGRRRGDAGGAAGRRAARRARTRRSTSRPGTRARSAASSPATPEAPARCATGPPAPTLPGWRRCRRRLGDHAADRPGQGQRRLRPPGAAGRLGGNPGSPHPRALEAVAAAELPRRRPGRRWTRSARRRAAGSAAPPGAVAGELRLLLRRGSAARPRAPAARVAAAPASAGLRPGRVRGAHRPHRGAGGGPRRRPVTKMP